MIPRLAVLLPALAVALWAQAMAAAESSPLEAPVPAWAGGLESPPEGWAPGAPYVDPYADDPVLVTITADNLETYREWVPDALQALLRRYPDSFRIPVYPTRRSHAAPEWVQANTRYNAEHATLTKDGNGFESARPGIPFPRPEQALEVYWNHVARWRGQHIVGRTDDLNVYPDGRHVAVGRVTQVRFDWYAAAADATPGERLFSLLSRVVSPPRQAGGGALVLEPINQDVTERQAWTYDASRRRVLRAPQLAFDSALPSADGLKTADDTDLINGSPSRYEWRLLGRRELIVPYNNYRINHPQTELDELIGPGHLAPRFTRFEKHGVWVIEGRLKAQWRHVYPRRVLYVDEDSWTVLIAQMHDANDEIWRVSLNFPFNAYQLPATLPAAYVFHDLPSGRYHVQGVWTDTSGPPRTDEPIPGDGVFTPSGLRRFVR